MVGAFSDRPGSGFLCENINTTLKLFFRLTIPPDGRAPRSISPVATPARVFLPPDNGIGLNFAPVCFARAKAPRVAGCANRLTPTFNIRFFPSAITSSIVLNLLRRLTNRVPGSLSTWAKYWKALRSKVGFLTTQLSTSGPILPNSNSYISSLASPMYFSYPTRPAAPGKNDGSKFVLR